MSGFFSSSSGVQKRGPIEILQDGQEFVDGLLRPKGETTIAFDYETTGLRPFRPGHRIMSCAVTTLGERDKLRSVAFPFEGAVQTRWQKVLLNARIRKIAHNLKYEHIWGIWCCDVRTQGWLWDPMVIARILNNQVNHTSLEDMAMAKLGVKDYKSDTSTILRADAKEEDAHGSNAFNRMKTAGLNEDVLYRNGLDAHYTMQLYLKQRVDFKFQEAWDFFLESLLALTEVELRGVKVDMPYLADTSGRLSKTTLSLQKDIWRMRSVAVPWKEKYGKKTNLNSNKQQAWVFYDLLKIKPTAFTKSGAPATDEETLAKIEHPVARKILDIRKVGKLNGTYIEGFQREQVDGFIHPCYNLHITRSYRSSCTNPNFQNIPVRDPVFGPIIRRAIIPRDPQHQIGEADYSALEVRIAACYHKDPEMLAYINDPTKDLHRDMTCRAFMLTPEQVTKPVRFIGKNSFVFPQFYGSYWLNIAPAMWKAASTEKLADGTPVLEHLAKKGIMELGTVKENKRGYFDPTSDDCFYQHVRELEIWFWTKKFKTYAAWRKRWYDSYLERGEFKTLTGFRCRGEMRRTEVINLPVQGSAFHCTLWSLRRLVEIYKKQKMDTYVLGQIHDSIVNDIHPPELPEAKRLLKQVMCHEVRERFKWIIVPLDIELELAPVGMSWNDKKKEPID